MLTEKGECFSRGGRQRREGVSGEVGDRGRRVFQERWETEKGVFQER